MLFRLKRKKTFLRHFSLERIDCHEERNSSHGVAGGAAKEDAGAFAVRA